MSSDSDVTSGTDGTDEVLHRLIRTVRENKQKKANINKAANSYNIYNRSQMLEDLDIILVSVRLDDARLVVPLVVVFKVFLVLVILVFICKENVLKREFESS